MKLLFGSINMFLEGIYWLIFPLLYGYLAYKGYLESIRAKGEDLEKGVLFHAASLGEVAAIRPLVLSLSGRYPAIKIGITTTTLGGLQQAIGITPRVKAWLAVLDLPHLRRKQLAKLNPGLICIVETEIWPNLLAWAAQNKVPVLFLNARMSARSLEHYKMIKLMFGYLESPIRAVLAQSETDAQRFTQIFKCPVHMAGNLKYCLQLPDYKPIELRAEWGYEQNDRIICFGSSRPGEEAMILSLWPKLKARFKHSKLIIAIRHPKRLPELVKLLSETPHQLYSQARINPETADVLIIDVLGVLDKAYALCDIAIVGGSFFDFGGHNPLEPAYYSKPVIMGQYHQSCRESVQKLVASEGLIISNPDSLLRDLTELLDDPDQRIHRGNKARQVLQDNSRALQVHQEAVVSAMRLGV